MGRIDFWVFEMKFTWIHLGSPEISIVRRISCWNLIRRVFNGMILNSFYEGFGEHSKNVFHWPQKMEIKSTYLFISSQFDSFSVIYIQDLKRSRLFIHSVSIRIAPNFRLLDLFIMRNG